MKEEILKTASELKQPSPSVAQEFLEKQEQLAVSGNQTIAARSDLDKLVGKDNLQMAMDNNRNFARFMSSLFSDYSPQVFVETVLWVFRAYRSHGFQSTYWAANLNIWVDMIQKELSQESYEAIYPFYSWLIVNIPIFVNLSDETMSDFSETDIPAH